MRRCLVEFPKFLLKASLRESGPKTPHCVTLAKISTSSMHRSSPEKVNVPVTPSSENIIWVDLEMTGLEPATCTILEAACIVTDRNVNVIAEGPNLIIHQPREILDAMDGWNTKHHTQSGLYHASLESKISLQQAEDQLLDFVKKYTPPGKCPLAGNTIYMDKIFLMKYMPRFCEHLHHRILDVSSVKIIAKNWYDLDPPSKVFRHRALDDIKESIQELLYYQKLIFQPVPTTTRKLFGRAE